MFALIRTEQLDSEEDFGGCSIRFSLYSSESEIWSVVWPEIIEVLVDRKLVKRWNVDDFEPVFLDIFRKFGGMCLYGEEEDKANFYCSYTVTKVKKNSGDSHKIGYFEGPNVSEILQGLVYNSLLPRGKKAKKWETFISNASLEDVILNDRLLKHIDSKKLRALPYLEDFKNSDAVLATLSSL